MISIEQWEQDGHYFDCQGHRIFYKTGGQPEAPALLLIHGFPTASWDWHRLWPVLCESFRVLTLDMIGFGLSDKPKKYRYGISNQADIYCHFLRLQGVKKFHVMAHDYGDTVAQELMARSLSENKPRLASVVLLNGGLFPETHKPVLLQSLLLSPLGGVIARLSSYPRFKKNFDRICAKPLSEEELQSFWQLLLRNNGKRVLPKLIHYITERQEHRERWVEALQKVKCPVRLIDGLDDPISGAHMVARYRELIPQPDVVELEGIGHYPQVEAHEQVLNNALAFWRQHQIIA